MDTIRGLKISYIRYKSLTILVITLAFQNLKRFRISRIQPEVDQIVAFLKYKVN